MFERLLVGLDGSPGSLVALDQAKLLGRRFSSAITIASISDLRVLEAPAFGAAATLWPEGPALPAPDPELAAVLTERARSHLAEGEQRIADSGLTVHPIHSVGLVDSELMRLGEEADLVLLGRGGRQEEGGSIGSVSGRLIRKSPCPVLLAAEQFSECVRPLMAHDGGPTSADALALAAGYARAAGVPLEVVHVSDDADAADALLSEARSGLETLGMDVATRRLGGDLVPALMAHVQASGADLLFVGAHRSRLAVWPTTSHTEKLARVASVPVIVGR